MFLEQCEQIATIRLAHGSANAIGKPFLLELNSLLDRVQASNARALLITGQGRFFSAGLDLPTLVAFERKAMAQEMELFEETMVRVFRLPLPVVAAINGFAIAGGCVLALQADYRLMEQSSAKIGLSEAQLGVGLPSVVLETLRVQVPAASLIPIALQGRLFSAVEAEVLGLVHEAIGPELLLERAREKARELGSVPKAAYAEVKAALRGPVVELVHQRQAAQRQTWLDGWFSAEAQTRLRATVDRLGKRDAR
jgi:enoyl-CoA hydratase